MEMGYIDKPLARGGRVVFRTRLHPVIFAGTAAFAAFVLGAVALIVSRNELSPRTVALLWLAGVLVGPGSLLPLYGRWRTSGFAVTDRRGRGLAGVVSQPTRVLGLLRDEASVGGHKPARTPSAGRLLA